MDDEFLAL
jgi:hypothetical protein